MNLYARVRNLLFLRSILKGNKHIERFTVYTRLVSEGFRIYKDFKKFGVDRNMMASVIRKLRKEFPYQIQGWTESEDLYKDYFKLKNHIDFKDLKIGDYVTRFRSEYPVKGERMFEYHTNKQWSSGDELPITYRVGSYNSDYKYFYTESNYYDDDGIDEDNVTSYLYATEKEIKEYEKDRRRRKRVQNKIDTLRKNIRNLEEEL